MTDNEIQKFLDVLLPYSDQQKRSESANEKLDAKKKDKLYQIARRLCFQKTLLKSNGSRLPKALKDILDILISLGYNQNMTKTVRKNSKGEIIYRNDFSGNPTTVSSGYTNMPFLIKQVLYLLSVRMLQCEVDNLFMQDIIEDMRNQPKSVKIGHHFLTDRLGKITPTRYNRCIAYKQPKNPLKYMGQKKGRLGTAIKHLVMQAEISFSYDIFIDVFGGSSSATVAPVYKKNVTYVYNDKDPLLTNYVKVVASDTLYDKLIDDIKDIQGIIQLGNNMEKYQKYIENRIPHDITKYKSKTIKGKDRTDVVIQRIERMLDLGESNVGYEPGEVKRFLADFQAEIVPYITRQDLEEEFEEGLTGVRRKYTKQEIEKFSNVGDFIFHYQVIRFLLEKHKDAGIKTPYSQDAGMDLLETEKAFRQYRAFGVLLFCKELYYQVYKQKGWHPKNEEERIEAASVLLILHYFSVNVEMGSDSSVMMDISKKSNPAYDRFCHEKFDVLIGHYHDSLRRLEEENIMAKDCLELIMGYQSMFPIHRHVNRKEYKKEHKEVLFYVDSPYVETKAYETNEKRWGIEEMKRLIDALFTSGQKFIFSMRACKESKGKKDNKQVEKTNEAILEVFRYFFKYHNEKDDDKKLYVLAADFNMDDLEERIKEGKQCEIMITNYYIQSFYDIGKKIDAEFINKKAYKVLEFSEFFNKVRNVL